jgi:integrase
MVSTGKSDAAAAQIAFEDWIAEKRRTRHGGPRSSDQVLVREVLVHYAKERAEEVASSRTLLESIEPLLWFFEQDTVGQLTPGRVRDYWRWRRAHSVRTTTDEDGGKVRTEVGRTIGDGTIIRELAGTLRPAIKHAIRQQRLDPGEYHIAVPPSPPPRDFWITRQEAAKLIWELRRDPRSRLHLPLYALIALYSGQRRSAVLDLTWKQVDLVNGRIDFNSPGRRQTKKRRPVIPIPSSLLSALKRAHGMASCDYVISYRGEKVRDIKTGFNSAAMRAGIPDCTSHTLRHTCATWLAMAGVPLREIALYLGNTLAMVERVYAKYHPDTLRGAVRALSRGR